MSGLSKPSLGPKRFLLFAGAFSPEGGWNDFIASYGTLVEALPKPDEYYWYHVVDLELGHIVAAKG